MTTEREAYGRPDEVRDARDERADGRPTGDAGPDVLRSGQDPASAPTEPLEEHDETPATEHAPGGDL